MHAPIEPMHDSDAITAAAEVIRAGGLVAFATETVYGLGGDATNADAVARIFAAKERPRFNPLISHYASTDDVNADAELSEKGRKLADAFWPGPLTLVAAKSPACRVSALTTAGLDTVAVRVPKSDTARRFLTACGVPVAAPSANRSGQMSPTRAEHVQMSLPGPDTGGPALILDDGPCSVGLESTVVDVTAERPTILRHGGIAREHIEEIVGDVDLADPDDDKPKSPGMLSRHYAPRARLRLDAVDAGSNEAFLGFGTVSTTEGLNLSESGDVVEAAANLFDMLHRLDAKGTPGIAVAPIPEIGLGVAINDRLRRGRS